MPSPCRRILAWQTTRLLLLLLGLHACGGGGGSTEPGVPSSLTVDPAAVSFTALGQTEQLSPTVVDGQGTPLPDEPVSWTSSNSAVATVNADGLVTAIGVGNAQVTASAGSASKAVQVEVVQTPSQLQKVAGDGQAATPGQPVAIRPAVAVRDANGNGVAGVAVTFEVVSGGGSITGGSATTNSSGIAEVGSWNPGSTGPNILRATAAGSGISGNPAEFTVTAASAFNIEVRFIGSATPAQQQAFAEAESRWERIITGDLQNVPLVAEPGQCGPSPAIDEVVDDLIILVNLDDIDGPGEVLASAGPCFIRISNELPVLGAMLFDTADLDDVEAAGLLSQVVLHEMGHVLGFGVGGGGPPAEPLLWDHFLVDPSLTDEGEVIEGADPHFTGPQAIAAFDQIGGSAYTGGKVPVEDVGDVGTQDSHWRESVFDAELMTGFINPGQNPLSRVTIASLRDLGFVVNESAADNFSLSLGAFARSASSPRLVLGKDVLKVPVKKVDAFGRVTSVLEP